jgi:hypothetical protein
VSPTATRLAAPAPPLAARPCAPSRATRCSSELRARLRSRLRAAAVRVAEESARRGCDLRTAALADAVDHVARAGLSRGLHP